MIEVLQKAKVTMDIVSEVVYHLRRQNAGKAYELSKAAMEVGQAFMECALQHGVVDVVNEMLPIWKNLLMATENRDEIWLADIYEQELMPVLYSIQKKNIEAVSEPIINWEKNMALLKQKNEKLYNNLLNAKEDLSRVYDLGWASTGELRLRAGTGTREILLHSSVNPWAEAYAFAENQVSLEWEDYIVFGFSLGYHIFALLHKVECQHITVIEHDLEQLRIAMKYMDLTEILCSDKVEIIYTCQTDEITQLLQCRENVKKIFWTPSVKTLRDKNLQADIENYIVLENSARDLGPQLEINFRSNQQLADEEVSVLGDEIKQKTAILVAGGPSVDNEIENLKKIKKEDALIFCVGKIAAKLISEGVRPDYIVMIDALDRTRWQINGIEECNIPLIYLATVSKKVASEYKGKRYIAYQKGFKTSEKKAKELGVITYDTGGSVATFTLDLLIRLGCERIICVGTDMAYTNNQTHAAGVGRRIEDIDTLEKVEGVGGRKVATSQSLNIFRIWIEKRIAKEDKILFYNTAKGAKIHGMKDSSLPEIFKEKDETNSIFIYVENDSEQLQEFLKKYDENSEIQLYTSIIESCDNDTGICMQAIMDQWFQAEKKSWFVTDIRDLYELMQEIGSAFYEKIIYLDTEQEYYFERSMSVENLMDLFIITPQDEFETRMLQIFCELETSQNGKDFYEYSNYISTYLSEERWKFEACLISLCALKIYMIQNEMQSTTKEFYLFATSMLMRLAPSIDHTNQFIALVLQSPELKQEDLLYFIYNQLKSLAFRKRIAIDDTTSEMIDLLYQEAYFLAYEKIKDTMENIPLRSRKKDRILVLTTQYLNSTHAPTKTVNERCKTLSYMGKEVYLINTTEQYTARGYIPMYAPKFGNVLDKYNEYEEVEIDREKVWFHQFSNNGRIIDIFQELCGYIQQIKPCYIMAIGSGSILADLASNFISTAEMSLTFSTIPRAINCMKILGRKCTKEEIAAGVVNDVIESRFTFELKRQNEKFTREEFGISEDAFVITVVGIRLDMEITKPFLDVLEKVCQKGCYVIFAGIYNEYDEIRRTHPQLFKKSKYIGYCNDILALMSISDLYANPQRVGGGFSIIEAFCMGVPGVYLPEGDVFTAGGEEFAVSDFEEMSQQILKYKQDIEYYKEQSEKAKKRADYMTDSVKALEELDEKIIAKILEGDEIDRYWYNL